MVVQGAVQLLRATQQPRRGMIWGRPCPTRDHSIPLPSLKAHGHSHLACTDPHPQINPDSVNYCLQQSGQHQSHILPISSDMDQTRNKGNEGNVLNNDGGGGESTRPALAVTLNKLLPKAAGIAYLLAERNQ